MHNSVKKRIQQHVAMANGTGGPLDPGDDRCPRPGSWDLAEDGWLVACLVGHWMVGWLAIGWLVGCDWLIGWCLVFGSLVFGSLVFGWLVRRSGVDEVIQASARVESPGRAYDMLHVGA